MSGGISGEGANPWRFHPNKEGSGKPLEDAAKEDAEKISALYAQNPIPGWGIQRIVAIHNPSLETLFEAKLKVMQARSTDSKFQRNWKINSEQEKLLDRLKRIAKKSSSYAAPHAMPMFYGTQLDLLQSISVAGFTNLSKRISHSSYAQFAQQQGDGTILVNWVAYIYPYPLISSERNERLKRGFDDLACDAYYSDSVSSDGSPSFNELCILDVSQVLPRFIVILSPEGLKVQQVTQKSTIPSETKEEAPKLSKSTSHKKEKRMEKSEIKPDELYQQGLAFLSRGNYDNAIAAFKLAAQEGNAEALAALGDCYFDGTGVVKDLRLAMELYQRAANKGHSWALFRLGAAYFEGVVVPKDCTIAFRNVESAIKFGLSKELGSAYCILGTCYREGEGVPKDLQKAIENYDLASTHGNADALAYKGWIIGQQKSKEAQKTAFDYYCEAAKLNSKIGQYNAGACLRIGLGTKKSSKKALEYFIAAGNQGHVEAQWSASLIYQSGDLGLIIDWPKVLLWARKAADQGHLEAKAYLVTKNI